MNASTLERIKAACAEAFGVTAAQIDGKSRAGAVADARACGIFLAGHVAWQPFSMLARQFGLRDHSSGSDAFHRVRREIDGDGEGELAEAVMVLADQLGIDISQLPPRPSPVPVRGHWEVKRGFDAEEEAAIAQAIREGRLVHANVKTFDGTVPCGAAPQEREAADVS